MCLCQVTLIRSRVNMYFPSSVFTLHPKLLQLFVCSAPKGFPRWKERWHTDVYSNHIPFQTHLAFCCQCSSVATLLDLISKQNGTILPSAELNTPTPARAVLTPDVITSAKVVSSAGWDMVKSHCRKYSVTIQRYNLMSCTVVTHADTNMIMFMRRLFPAVQIKNK